MAAAGTDAGRGLDGAPGDPGEALTRRVLSLPPYPQMTARQVERCVGALAAAVAS